MCKIKSGEIYDEMPLRNPLWQFSSAFICRGELHR